MQYTFTIKFEVGKVLGMRESDDLIMSVLAQFEDRNIENIRYELKKDAQEKTVKAALSRYVRQPTVKEVAELALKYPRPYPEQDPDVSDAIRKLIKSPIANTLWKNDGSCRKTLKSMGVTTGYINDAVAEALLEAFVRHT